MSEPDTDTLLAILASLFDSDKAPADDILLDALVRSNGNVELASESLRQKYSVGGDSTPVAKKRIATGMLDGWFIPSNVESSQSRKKSKVTLISTGHETREQAAMPLSYETSGMATSSKSPSKPLVSLAEVLRPPPPSSSSVPRLAPLMLSNATMVEKHTPCTLHLGILPQELACRLFHLMVNASQEWKPNKWWLFDRVVESPHKTSFYARQVDGISDDQSWQEAAQYWYNGRPTPPPKIFPPEMEEACQMIEQVVNEAISKRLRYPLEWGGSGTEGQIWRANVAASNCYTGAKEGVGFHSDQLTYLGPYPTIASLSLGTTRTFRLREVIPQNEVDKRQAQTFNIPLVHNSLIIMHASTQERFKHSIPQQSALDLFRPAFPSHLKPDSLVEPSNCRINITFRFYRPDFRPPSIPRCRCDVPCVLRADMKGRGEAENNNEMRYFWMCYAGAQNDGKGCGFFKVMDAKAEGRGPFVKNVKRDI